MSKSWKKILVTGASLLMFASVSAGTSQVVHPAHAEAYTQQLTGSLKHSIRFGHHFYRKGSPVYGAQSLGDPTHMYVYLGHDTVDQRYIPDSYYSHSLPVHHHHHRLVRRYRRPVRRHYRKHARKHYRRPVKKAKKHVTRKRKARKAHKAIKRQTKRTTAHKPSRKVNKFRKSAYYHNSWTHAEKLNERGVNYDLKMAKKYVKNGNTKAAKKARQKANYLKIAVKHDQTMINLGK